jgi:2-oxoglutarate ferredoxin oxidoreductase subunit alpha
MFLRGNEALAEAAIRAGCRFYAGYPITPSTEILEYMAKRMPEVGGVCMFPGTEIEGITMVQGAAGAGVRSMIASASTAYSLMQETLAEAANGGWPMVVVNMCRGALQGDYYQTAKGGGHGDYQILVLAPHTNQEMADLTQKAFDIAERYRHPVIIFGDALLAKTTETVVFSEPSDMELPEKVWAADGRAGRPRNSMTFLGKSGLSTDTRGSAIASQQRFWAMAEREAHWETGLLDDAEIVVVAFGTAARYAKRAIEELRSEGIRIGFLRPIAINPFPTKAVAEAAIGRKLVISYELNSGQMIHDVRSAVFGAAPVESLADNVRRGSYGGVPFVGDVADQFRDALRAHGLLSAEEAR